MQDLRAGALASGQRGAQSEQPRAAASDAATQDEAQKLARAVCKRDWLLDAMQRQSELAPGATEIERRADLSSDEFLERYYAPQRPVILIGEMRDWPALTRWTPSYLKQAVGPQTITYQGGRNSMKPYEYVKSSREMPFDRFIDLVAGSEGNDSYMTANDSDVNQKALAALHQDQGLLEKFLSRTGYMSRGMTWIGPAGTHTNLHHDLTNNLVAQVVGRKRWKLTPAADVGKMYNFKHVYSRILDLDDPAFDASQYPLRAAARVYDVTISPGEVIFIPFAWWHQVKALDFSVSVTFINFRWPNQAMPRTFPAD